MNEAIRLQENLDLLIELENKHVSGVVLVTRAFASPVRIRPHPRWLCLSLALSRGERRWQVIVWCFTMDT